MAKPVDVVFKAVCSTLGLMTVAGGLWFTTLGAGTYERAREASTMAHMQVVLAPRRGQGSPTSLGLSCCAAKDLGASRRQSSTALG
jgi:hypothetical protein